MSAPQRPWEQLLNSSAHPPNGTYSIGFTTPAGRLRGGPPNLPPRPQSMAYGGQQNLGYNSNSYNMYGRSLGYNPYSNIGSYAGGYGGYGGMYGGYSNPMYGAGVGYGAESRFIQLAEESTRPAFQSIESLVRAFGSISMMLDSTFFAVSNSFRAVLGVAENFGRIRSMFGQLWSSFAIFRMLNWLYRKVLSLLGFKVSMDAGSEAWNQALNESVTEGFQNGQNGSSWPIFMFLGIIISAPYLISRMLPPLVDKRDPKNWPSEGCPINVSYQFVATNPQELSIEPGETIRLAPLSVQRDLQVANSGWVLAASSTGFGLVPFNYLQRPPSTQPQSQSQPQIHSEQPTQPKLDQ